MKRLGTMVCLAALVSSAPAEWTPPGDYSATGRVVRTARGSVELFDGRGGRLLLSERLQKELSRHVGEFVRVDYTRSEDEKEAKDAVFDVCGAPIVKIRKVTTLAKDAASLPLGLAVRPLAERVPLGEPLRVQITFTNRTDAAASVEAASGDCNLLQDYQWVLSLAPEGRRASDAGTKVLRIEPRAESTVTLTSAWMAEPGTYDVVFTLPAGDRPFAPQSDPVQVTVLPARDAAEERAALRAWVTRASPSQRIRLAERLLALGDDSGVDEVLRLFGHRAESGIVSYGPLYRFMWEHGGARGESAMLRELAQTTGQDPALRFIEDVPLSPRAVALLEGFLADGRETGRDIAGWCPRPRICDLTADWLSGYTDGKLVFPKSGSVAERDAAVANVLKALREKPTLFSVLARK
jgi:hypothetical protein